MHLTDRDILYEDNHLLVVLKPAGLPTMGVAAGKPSLLEAARQYLKDRYRKPGQVYLGAMSRLDAPVSGAILLARTSKAASRLTEQFRNREVEKTYWALVEGAVEPARGQWTCHLAHDDRHRRVHVVGPQQPGALEARLAYRRLAARDWGSHVEIALETGRKHQIRAQFADHGHPVLGDRKYGATQPFPQGIALHARRLAFEHPVRRGPIELVAPLPDCWRRYGVREDAG